jgi:hypothetical protein
MFYNVVKLTLSYLSEASPAFTVFRIVNSKLSEANYTWISSQPQTFFLW